MHFCLTLSEFQVAVQRNDGADVMGLKYPQQKALEQCAKRRELK